MWCPKHSKYYNGRKAKNKHRQECNICNNKLRNAELEEEKRKKEEKNK